MLTRVIATRFDKRLSSGRTKPCVVHCETFGGEQVEIVLKTSAGCEVRGLICEAMASMLADDLDLPIPASFQVEVSDSFARSIPDQEMRELAKKSIGINFGTRKLPPQFGTWPRNRPIPLALRPLAGEVFAFDAVIQNPDRRFDNPNCLQRGTELYILDHDLAFSFLMPIIGLKLPWQAGGLDFLKKPQNRHLFYDGLSGNPIDLSRFSGALEGITPARIAEYRGVLPEGWRAKSDAADKICEYLLELRQHVTDVIAQVNEVLR